MAGFEIGGSGGAHPKARALPKGTLVRIIEAADKKSKYTHVPEKGPNAGKELPRVQLMVIYEAMEAGTTLAYKDGKGKDVPAAPFAVGDRFVQYYGGVYYKDNDNPSAGVRLTQAGGAYGFVSRLAEQGVEPTGDFGIYTGLTTRLDHESGRGPQGPYVLAMPGELVEDAPAPAAKPAKAPAKAAKDAAPAAPKDSDSDDTDATNAFASLSADDQAAILEVGSDLTAQDVLDAGIASDLKHAEAILAARPSAKPKLTRKKVA